MREKSELSMENEDLDPESREPSRQTLVRFIPDLTSEETAELVPYLEPRHFPAGTVIRSEGEMASHLGFLLSGRLSVRKSNRFSDRPILVAVLESWAVFGERGLAGGFAADVTLAAMEDSRALLLSYDRIGAVCRNNPDLGLKILFSCLKITGRRLQGATARIVDIL